MFEIGNSLREARVRQQLELARSSSPPRSAAATCGRSRRRASTRSRPRPTSRASCAPTRTTSGSTGSSTSTSSTRASGDGDEPREPVVARRTSHVARQHRRLERRWIAFALAGIAALVVFFIAAWKSGGNPNETIPNLGTTNTTPAKKVLPAATSTKHAADEAGLVPALRARAERQLLDGGAQLVERAARAASPARSSPASRSASSRAGSGSTSATRGTWRWSTTATSST